MGVVSADVFSCCNEVERSAIEWLTSGACDRGRSRLLAGAGSLEGITTNTAISTVRIGLPTVGVVSTKGTTNNRQIGP